MTARLTDLRFCRGCDNDFYNGNNPLGVKRCWYLSDAKIVTRFKIGWWTAPTVPGAFEKVKTLNCHTESGQYAFFSALPSCATKARVKRSRPRVAALLVVCLLLTLSCTAPKPGEPVCKMETRGAPTYCQDKAEATVPCPKDTSRLPACPGQRAR